MFCPAVRQWLCCVPPPQAPVLSHNLYCVFLELLCQIDTDPANKDIWIMKRAI